MNIGIFTDCYTPEVNGIVTSLRLFINAFRVRGHSVFIFAPDNENKNDADEINVERFPSTLVWGKQVRLSLPFIKSKKIAALNLDIIHVQTPGPIGMVGTRLGKKLHIPLVYTYHTRIERYAHFYAHLPLWVEKGALTFAAKVFYNRHAVVVAPSNGIKRELSSYVKSPISVIPTGIDTKKNQAQARTVDAADLLRRYGVAPSDEFIITTSRLGKEKNISFIIDAFCSLHSKRPATKLLIVGEGPDREDLANYAANSACRDHIIFLGLQPHDTIFALYQKAKVFVFSSLTETQGMVVLEALTMGLPVVALAGTGTEDLLAGDMGGFMVAPHPELFTQKILELVTCDKLWEQKHLEALQRATEFSINNMAERMLALYSSLAVTKKK
jgi:glycosyltransferase involved in cell wall biosynthesis